MQFLGSNLRKHLICATYSVAIVGSLAFYQKTLIVQPPLLARSPKQAIVQTVKSSQPSGKVLSTFSSPVEKIFLNKPSPKTKAQNSK